MDATHQPSLRSLNTYCLRCLHYSYRTEEAYVDWARRFLSFAQAERVEQLDADRVRAFLERLAVVGKVSASTQNQALNALVFFFREGLSKELGQLGEFTPAKRPRKIPVVLTRAEVGRLFHCLSGENRLMARLLYGSGLRLMECVRLRVKDVDLERRQIVVRDGKDKDRVTMLPETLVSELEEQLKRVKHQHEEDLKAGHGKVYLPEALSRKYPNACREWAWQYVFPADRLSVDQWIRERAEYGGTMRARTRFNGRYRRQSSRRGLPRQLRAIRCVTMPISRLCRPGSCSFGIC